MSVLHDVFAAFVEAVFVRQCAQLIEQAVYLDAELRTVELRPDGTIYIHWDQL